jgi:hypothetical protein
VSAFLSYLIIRSSPKRYEKRYELWDLSDLRANSAALLVLISSSLLTGGPFSTVWAVHETSYGGSFCSPIVSKSYVQWKTVSPAAHFGGRRKKAALCHMAGSCDLVTKCPYVYALYRPSKTSNPSHNATEFLGLAQTTRDCVLLSREPLFKPFS